MKFKLLLLTVLFVNLSWGQISEGFESGLPTSYSAVTSFSLGSGTWTGAANQVIRGNSGVNSGTYSCQLKSQTGSQITSPLVISGGVGTVSFWATSSTATGSVQVNYRVGGGSWIPATGSPFAITSTKSQYTATINNASSNIEFQFYRTASTVYIDDVLSTQFTTPSLVNVSTSTLSGFNYVVGSGPSAEQSFTVSGSNLTSNIVLTAPANYEISTTSGVGFTNSITLTRSGGNVALTAIYVRLKLGLAVNAYNGEIVSLTSAGATNKNVSCSGSVVNLSTPFEAGDFAVIALNSNISCYPAGPNGAYTAGDDEISFITFRDIQNGDSFHITDNGFERENANQWANSEGLYKFTRTGSTIPAGTVITFRFLNTSPFVEFNSPDASWSFVKETGFGGNLVMNSGGDQIFFTQGGTWNNPGGIHDATYVSGNYLYGFNTSSSWVSIGKSTQKSALPFGLSCFSLMPGAATDYLEYTGPTTAATKLDWIARLNNPTNWTDRTNCTGYSSMHVGQSYAVTMGGTYIDGVWIGSKNTDWFDCSNWQTLKVPDALVNVDVNSTYAVRDAVIDVSSANATIYGNLAKANDVTISANKIQLEGNVNNVLEIHGNLLINSAGQLDMDDGTAATDGTIHLFGNWTNNAGNASFLEGNGTVHFDGNTNQIINNVTPVGTEEFYNVVLNNNFDTSISNDLIALGSLTNNASKTLIINTGDYVQVNKLVTNNGVLNVENNGSLVQKEDGFVNIGNISYKRTVSIRLQDYVYWSSPVSGFTAGNISPGTSSFYNFSWNPVVSNPNGGWGNWYASSGETMLAGKGYITRAPNAFNNVTAQNFTANFNNGVPNNGVITVPVSRANNVGADIVGTNGTTITKFDDNWNLVGNPYPSAINVAAFLALNTNIEGAVRIWTHGNLPNVAISDPFYQDFYANYTPNDYITHNGVGTVSGPVGFNGYIAGGQSFLVNMLDGAAATENIQFNNSLRDKLYNNSQFYRSANQQKSTMEIKNRIWLDIVSSSNVSDRTLIGYVEGATNEKDRMFDAVVGVSGVMRIYSIIDEDKMTIQGRSLPFDSEDKVKIGFFAPNNGLYSIAIAAVDGLFSTSQDVFLEDKKLNLIHNLKQGVYSFSSELGQFNDRFVLRYTDRVLSEENFSQISNDVIVFANEKIQISSSKDKIKSVVLYDVLGRILYSRNNLDVNQVDINEILPTNNTLIVKIGLENNSKVVKKIVF